MIVGAALRWPLWKRIGFRFLSIYFVLYALPFPFDYIPGIGPRLDAWWVSIWAAIVPRLAKLFLSRPIVTGTAGSSDMTFHYLQILCFMAIAALATLLWGLLDRGRTDDARLYRFVHSFLRVYVASAMFSYGIQKIIPAQFPPPSLDRLVQTIGSTSPMGFLWTFMGASPAYEIFAGAAELLAALLLIARRTALLGALVTIAVMSNVVALNLFFDASIKTYSSHLLLMAVFLAAPDARKLADFFLRRSPEPLFESRWAHVGWLLTGALLVALFVYTGVSETLTFYRETISTDRRSPLRGIWNVDALDVDGVPRPPLVTDAARWRRVVFDYPGQSSIFLMSDERNLYRTRLDEKKRTIDFVNRFDPQDVFRLKYARPDHATLQLDGTVGGHAMHAVCRLEEKQFLLTSRGFHWINERALNR
jgi:hypothetical protein